MYFLFLATDTVAQCPFHTAEKASIDTIEIHKNAMEMRTKIDNTMMVQDSIIILLEQLNINRLAEKAKAKKPDHD